MTSEEPIALYQDSEGDFWELYGDHTATCTKYADGEPTGSTMRHPWSWVQEYEAPLTLVEEYIQEDEGLDYVTRDELQEAIRQGISSFLEEVFERLRDPDDYRKTALLEEIVDTMKEIRA